MSYLAYVSHELPSRTHVSTYSTPYKFKYFVCIYSKSVCISPHKVVVMFISYTKCTPFDVDLHILISNTSYLDYILPLSY